MASQDVLSLFKTFIDFQNSGRWDDLSKLIQPTISVNGIKKSSDTFVSEVKYAVETHSQRSKLDTYVVDSKAQGIAVRIIKNEASEAGSFQFQEIALVWFKDDLLARFDSLQDADDREAKKSTINNTPNPLQWSQSSTSLDLRVFYKDYIASINGQTMEENFGKFCQPTVTHNDRAFTTAEYISLIRDSQTAIKGLHFGVTDVLVNNDSSQIAALIEFTGVPVETWAGAEPNGKGVKFHEHAMYWLKEDKITRVASIVEIDAYREQLKR